MVRRPFRQASIFGSVFHSFTWSPGTGVHRYRGRPVPDRETIRRGCGSRVRHRSSLRDWANRRRHRHRKHAVRCDAPGPRSRRRKNRRLGDDAGGTGRTARLDPPPQPRGPGVLPGVNALLLGYVLYRSGLVPRVIPNVRLIGAPFFLISTAESVVGITHTADHDLVFFTAPGLGLVAYPAWVAQAVTVAAAAAFVTLVALARRRRHLRLTRGVAGAAALLGMIVGATVLSQMIWRVLLALNPGSAETLHYPDFALSTTAMVAILTVMGLAFVAACRRLSRRINAIELTTGAPVLWWLILAILLGLGEPLFSPVGMWPLVGGITPRRHAPESPALAKRGPIRRRGGTRSRGASTPARP